jgi:hypothetical protein
MFYSLFLISLVIEIVRFSQSMLVEKGMPSKRLSQLAMFLAD